MITPSVTGEIDSGEISEGNNSWAWSDPKVILILMNAILGFILFEWAWCKMYRFRHPIKELEAIMPAYRRDDASKWAKWKFYPGAVTCMIPRFIFGVACFAFLCVFLFFALIGQPMDKPLVGCRRLCVRWVY